VSSPGSLRRLADLPLAEAYAQLVAMPGIGAWTAAEVGRRALGDADAVSVGDAHTAELVGWVLTGSPVDDATMLALLERWRPHRQRVVRLLEMTYTSSMPRRGPRRARADLRRL
jgi:3-methyladenine DNA glycosylase/8-oxoguanine DNA glycosylase